MSSHPTSKMHHALSLRWCVLLLAVLLAFPLAAHVLGQEFYIGLASRLLIFALAASSLNLILGFGGMVSLGHAAYFGAGAYTIGILMQCGVASAWLAWPAATFLGSVLALLIGSVLLLTRGGYSILITLDYANLVV